MWHVFAPHLNIYGRAERLVFQLLTQKEKLYCETLEYYQGDP